MTDVTSSTVPRIADDVVRIPVGDELLLHREDDGTLLRLDELGALVMTLVDGTRSIAGIVDELDAFFDAGRPTIAEDVHRLLGEITDAGLLELQQERQPGPSRPRGSAP